MGNINKLLNNTGNNAILASILVIIISFILYKIITHIIIKSGENNLFKRAKSNKSKTYLKMLKSIIRYTFLIITTLIVLEINGVDVTSAIAGVGIASIVLGFAIQDLLKDIIKGVDIISDKYFQVGDVIRYNDIEGKVISIGIKTTKIETLKDSGIISISNRNIEQVEVKSNFIYLEVPMPYEIPVERAEEVIECIVTKVGQHDNVNGCKYKGVNDLADSRINYLIEINCNPIYKLQVRRDALRNILVELDKNGIKVPYNQIDVHQKID